MRKFTLPLMLVLTIFLVVYSCKKEEYSEMDAYMAQQELALFQDSIQGVRDSLNHLTGIIQYSVSVVDVSGGAYLKSSNGTEGINDATVTVSQHGIAHTKQTSNGIAVFNDLRVGTVSVNVNKLDFTEVDFIAKIQPEDDSIINVYYDVLRYAATMIPVFSTTENLATVSGIVTCESDLTNDAVEPASNVEVIWVIDVDDVTFKDRYLCAGGCSGMELESDKYYASIQKIAYGSMSGKAVSGTDGSFSLPVPSTADGLPINIEVSDIAINQTLLMNTLYGVPVFGPQQVRTIFSSEIRVADVSVVPTVDASYVVFSAPTGSAAPAPAQEAIATAQVAASGIENVVIQNQGAGYTQAPVVLISNNTDINGNMSVGEGAELSAQITDGRVTAINVNAPGIGYTAATVNLVDKIGGDATAAVTMSYSIANLTLAQTGWGYTAQPNIVIQADHGSGVSAEAVMSGYVSDYDVTNGGSGYVCDPIVELTGGNSAEPANAVAVMSTNHPIHSIELNKPAFRLSNYWYETAPLFSMNSGVGSGATGIVQLSSDGRLARIEITDPGVGYTTVPAIIVTGGAGWGAVVEAQVIAGQITGFTIHSGGEGFTSVPTISISAPPSGGTQATANAVLEYAVEGVVLTNNGNGYNIDWNEASGNDLYVNEPTLEFDGASVFMADAEIIVKPSMFVVDVINNTAFTTPEGEAYQSAPTVTFMPRCGYGSGATATASILYKIEEVAVNTVGTGYRYNDDITVVVENTGGQVPETPAIFSVDPASDLYNGIVESIELTKAGEGYTASPRIWVHHRNDANYLINGELNEPSAYAEIGATVAGGMLTSMSIISAGQGYVADVAGNFRVTISTNISPASALVDVNTNSGMISFVTIDVTGEGYQTVPRVEFLRRVLFDGVFSYVTNSSYTDAEATAVVNDGEIVQINVINPGNGYFYPPEIKLSVPNYVETARGECTIVNGRITGVDFTNGTQGGGYISEPTVTFTPSITGKGSGATGSVVVRNGQIESVIMTNQGTGYIGVNNPAIKQGFGIIGAASFNATASKTYVKDIHMGTGKRSVEN